ncbi:MAG: glycosyltransferase [Candidatus Marinimicrobia bacterium]|nr:glycosyltransferase [Candidatus Neomarinimicrobiota bacterium]
MKRKSGRLSTLKREKSQVSPAMTKSLRLGLNAFENGDFSAAVEHLSDAAALHPTNSDILSALGHSYLKIGNYEDSAAVFSEIVELEPDNQSAYKTLSTALCQIGDLYGAEKYLQKSLDLNPSDAEALNDMGVLWHLRGNPELAKTYFEKSLKEDRENIDAENNIGLVYVELENYSKAEEIFSDLRDRFPDDTQIRKQLTGCFLLNDKTSKAYAELNWLKESGFEDAETRYFSGKAYYSSGELEKAEDAFRSSLELDPENILTKESLATTLLRIGKDSEALEMWESMLSLPEKAKNIKSYVTPRLTDWDKIGKFNVTLPPNKSKGNGSSVGSAEISIVIPVLEEEGNIVDLTHELQEVMDKVGGRYEIIYIDDGSKDRTFEFLKRLRNEDKRIKILRFRKNYGQTAALAAGFNFAVGDVVVTLDGDLQNDPADIPKLIEKLAEGYDMVSGWRVKRKDNLITRRLPSLFANKIIGKITGTELHDYGCALKAYKKGVIKNIRLYGEMHRFIPAVVSWLGAEIAEIPVNHRPRVKGNSKYDLTRTWRVILDLINVKFLLSYLTRPLQYFGKLGLIFIGLPVVAGIGMLGARVLFGIAFSSGIMFSTALLMVLMGIQFITIGLIAEIIIRTYHESQEKPIYAMKEVLD